MGLIVLCAVHLDHFYQEDVFIPWLEAQKGYLIPMAPGYAENEMYTGDPTLAPYPAVSSYARNKGYAGPADQKAAEASARYIVVNAFAQAAIEQAASQLERVYGG